jgi:N-carbamoyl-L-amino-acid hydrolase
VPREYRQDALFAAADLTMRLERRWDEWLAAGRDVVCTLGRFHTDPQRHSLTKVPGSVRFTVDIRSLEASLLQEARDFLLETAGELGRKRGVEIDLGPLDVVEPTPMDQGLLALLDEQARALGIPTLELASGAGHDAANFGAAGVSTAMIFVRNDHGSHNPHEAMDMPDFVMATRLLLGFLMHAY